MVSIVEAGPREVPVGKRVELDAERLAALEAIQQRVL
jgi:hypothetical protein